MKNNEIKYRNKVAEIPTLYSHNFTSRYYIKKIKSWKYIPRFKRRQIKTFSIQVDEPFNLLRKILFFLIQ